MRGSSGLAILLAVAAGAVSACQLAGLPGGHVTGAEAPAASTARTGSLEVRFTVGSPGARSAQAVVADVERIDLALRQDGAADRTLSISRDQIAAGHATATFETLWPRDAILSVQALGADGTVLGAAEKTAPIRSNETTTIAVSIRLSASETVGGNLMADIELIDGPNVVTTPLPIRADVSVVDGTTITAYPSPAVRTEITILDGPVVYVTPTPTPAP